MATSWSRPPGAPAGPRGGVLRSRGASRDKPRRSSRTRGRRQYRLYRLFHRIAARRPTQIAALAGACELVGFLWAAMHEAAGVATQVAAA